MGKNSGRSGKNGKVNPEELSMKESIIRLENKIDRISEVLNHINVILSERISNHAARIQSLETAISELRNSQY